MQPFIIIFTVLVVAALALAWYSYKVKKKLASLPGGPEEDTVAMDVGNNPLGLMEWGDGERIAILRTGGLFRKMRFLTISSHTNEGARSTAEVSGDFSLSGNSSHTYYGVYPAGAFRTSRGKVMVSGDIPEHQTLAQDYDDPRLFKTDLKKYGYRYAISSGKSSDNGKRVFRFRPLVNSYVFKIHSPAENYMDRKLVSVMLSSDQEGACLSGTFMAKLDPETLGHAPLQKHEVEGGRRFVTASFSDGVSLGKSPEEETTIRIVCLPMDHTKLKLSLKFEDGTIRSIHFRKDDRHVTTQACGLTVFSGLAVPGTLRTVADQAEVEPEPTDSRNTKTRIALFT